MISYFNTLPDCFRIHSQGQPQEEIHAQHWDIRDWVLKLNFSLGHCAIFLLRQVHLFFFFFFEKCWCVKPHFLPQHAGLWILFLIDFQALRRLAEKLGWWAVLPQYSWCWKGNCSSVRTMPWKICKTQSNTPKVCMKGQALLTVPLTVRTETEKPSSPSAMNVPG